MLTFIGPSSFQSLTNIFLHLIEFCYSLSSFVLIVNNKKYSLLVAHFQFVKISDETHRIGILAFYSYLFVAKKFIKLN